MSSRLNITLNIYDVLICMKKCIFHLRLTLSVLLLLAVFLVPAWPLLASAADAGQAYLAAQQKRLTAEQAYKTDLAAFNADKTPENEKQAVTSGKVLLSAWLDEAQTWLEWKDAQAQEDANLPQNLRDDIHSDVAKNLEKISGLRQDVDGVETLGQGVLVFLKMIGAYGGLLADVARNTGAAWVIGGNKILANADAYEVKLRTAAEKKNNSAEIIPKLDMAKSALAAARNNVNAAEAAYKLVVTPGTPLVRFADGNRKLNQARLDLLSAQAQMAGALSLIISK